MEVEIQKLLVYSFTAWAGVVAWIGRGLLKRLDKLTNEISRTDEKLSSYILQTETRLGILEDRVNASRFNP